MNKNCIYTKRESRIIYILFSPTKNIFYINHCLKTSIKEVYRHNIKGRRALTKNFIEEIKPHRPCLFILEELKNSTRAEANKLVLVWLKILIENGYKSYNNPKFINLTNHLYFYNQRLYEERKNTKLEQMFLCENCFIPNYKNIICKKYPNEKRDET